MLIWGTIIFCLSNFLIMPCIVKFVEFLVRKCGWNFLFDTMHFMHIHPDMVSYMFGFVCILILAKYVDVANSDYY
jgi:hypothetical protein